METTIQGLGIIVCFIECSFYGLHEASDGVQEFEK